MKKRKSKKGFSLIEIMLGISIAGLLAALSIPAILGAYSNAQAKTRDNNIAAVEKAKGVLTLPSSMGMPGAMGLDKDDPFDDTAISNLCKALRINDLSELKVGNMDITIGTLTEKAEYL